jgi:hypothetical protein
MLTARSIFRLLFCLFAGLGAAALSAQVVVMSYVQTGSLPANDDHHSGNTNELGESLGFSIDFGGTTYTKTFVSNNGYISFGQGSSNYSPYSLNASYEGLPIIAAFFSDVDTRDQASGIVTWGTGLVDGKAAFVAKWNTVGEYGAEDFSPNTFEIVLVSRSDTGAGNFDIFLNYETITWDHYGAVAGFHNGSSTNPLFYQLPGSLEEGAFLDSGTNSLTGFTNNGAAGDFLLSARDGGFLGVAPIVAIPEPSTYALLLLGGGLLWLGARRRRA